jgi:hypothetical protein
MGTKHIINKNTKNTLETPMWENQQRRGFIGFKGINLHQQKIHKFFTTQQTQLLISEFFFSEI